MKNINLILIIMFLCSFRVSEKPKVIPEIKSSIKKETVIETPCEKGAYYGLASYYGEYWDGRTTANMEIYDCKLLTCASPTLPFNTLIKVTNLDNNKSIIIRVNDRGPYKMNKDGKALKPLIPHPKRILDLSKSSFKTIGNLKKGVLRIKYEIVG